MHCSLFYAHYNIIVSVLIQSNLSIMTMKHGTQFAVFVV